MTTAQDVVTYAKSKLNQKVTVPTNPYGGQCVAFIDHIVQHFSNKNLAYTNAIDCLKKAKSQGLEVIYNNPNDVNLIPKSGDFFVMSSVASDGIDYGHIGVVVSADTKGMVTLEQNIDGWSDNNRNGINDQLERNGGGYVRNNKRSYAGVTGWFRLPYNNSNSSSSKNGAINHNGEVYSNVTTHFNPNVMYSNLSPGVKDYSRLPIDRIVIHHNATTNKNIAMQTWYESSKNWTSANYEVADNEIWGCVGEQYVAFHSGDSTMNRRSIGIEHVNSTGSPDLKISEATYKSSAKLIADICKRYKIPIDAKHIIPHKQVSPTACPGGIDMAKLIRMAQEVSKGAAPAAKQTASQKPSTSFRVKVSVSDLNIRKSASLKSGKNGVAKPGVYTITQTKSADGYEWGKLKSGAGWIALKYAKKL